MTHVLLAVAFPWLVGPEAVRVPAHRADFVRAQLARTSAVLLAAAVAPLSLETSGDPCSANSAAPQGCMGQGMGSMPMSTDVQPVPLESAPTASTTAQGIVTRMGQDTQWRGGKAIEPGPEGMRPAFAAFGAFAGAFDCAAAAPSERKRSTPDGAAAAFHTPPSNTGVNKNGSGHGV